MATLEQTKELNNYMEEMVDECLQIILRRQPVQGFCACPQCQMEIRKEALNNLPTFYVTGKVGEVYGEYHKMQQQYSADITIAVSRAIEVVASRGHRQ